MHIIIINSIVFMWVKQCHVYHPPVITIFIGDMFTIPSHEWFMALFCQLGDSNGVNGSDVDETLREMVVQGPSGTLAMRLASPTK